MDGGTIWNINLVSAVERCREQVDDDSQITIDIISCQSHHLSDQTEDETTIGNFLRSRAIKDFHSSMENIFRFRQAFPLVKFRYIVMPSDKLYDGIKMIDFANSTTWKG